ncbi:Uncharacterized protein OS=Pirellula staleyi (strain ATCC 27377 / DSM 6068 / ICPB 4128) GN=Psta_0831 PE=4 SV=1 [Gemmata massiliana]|uniref:J domain-containing protein n=1 Tax=Gemmata massiliana TaxID=1210884 RepID=A0A6P2DFF7_9BACT|nr:J domain-containing protein [Gemmata massiliana]VTR98374.1 Uncharacterized protein OS=Pirellula staleyi (strain ATCC 27377 / DSM 6068 / ICPB 4128) GN=Psta_0831 PE=4 SV=1 [Gemmata massiliana]
MERQSHDQLCSWLGLPPGAWPPDHYTLLGLERGAGDFADIESRVLDRMELLRRYQLLHPDPVTAGMNRLAQALVCLTDPTARAAYDRGLGIAIAPFEVVDDEPPSGEFGAVRSAEIVPVEVAFESGLGPPGEDSSAAYKVADPTPVPYEVVPEELIAEELPEPDNVPGAVPALPLPAIPVARINQLKPRTVYRRLAALRRALRAWDGLRPVMGNPTEALATPISVLLFIRAVASARDALPRVAFVLNEPGAPGALVTALVSSSHTAHTVRTLLPSQRQSVALDWRRGYDVLRREHDQLRALALGRRARRRANSGANFLLAFRRTPELALVALALAALFVSLIRRNS